MERGIRKTRFGFEAYARVRGRQVSRRFPPTATIEEMRAWREHRRPEGFSLPPIAPPTRATSGGFVYFIQSGNFVKVGKARCIAQRLEELQTAHPEPLRLVAYIPCANPSRIEATILDEYRASSARGEWLRITPDVERLIQHHAKLLEPLLEPTPSHKESTT
jgi:hypothetical protein